MPNHVHALISLVNRRNVLGLTTMALRETLLKRNNTATLDNKQKMLGLMFPEKLVFSNNTFQTIKPSELLTLLCSAGKDFGNWGK